MNAYLHLKKRNLGSSVRLEVAVGLKVGLDVSELDNSPHLRVCTDEETEDRLTNQKPNKKSKQTKKPTNNSSDKILHPMLPILSHSMNLAKDCFCGILTTPT